MKIFLPFKLKDIGGTSTFAGKFRSGLEALGHEVSLEPTSDYDVLFLIVQAPFRYLIDAKKRGKKIIQRLDGTYYWTVSGWRFPLLNAKASLIRRWFADFTVYQSQYSKECVERFLGPKRGEAQTIIYNGVDLNLFSPLGPTKRLRDNAAQKVFFTASAFRREDQILPVIEALRRYRRRYSDNCKLVIAGSFEGKVKALPNWLRELEFVEWAGRISNHELPSYERGADVFLFTHLNPPCPNNVIEALACGLPVCGINDGAMGELISSGKEGELLRASGTGFWRGRSFNARQYADNIERICRARPRYAQAARRAAEERFGLETMAKHYLAVFHQVIQ